MKKIILIFLLFFFSCNICVLAQEKFTYEKMDNILRFNRYITLRADSINIKDTATFVSYLVSYYKNIDNEYSDYIPYYGKEKKNAFNSMGGVVDATYSWGTVSLEKDFLYRKDFTVLFYIENVLIGSDDTLRIIIERKNQNRIIYGKIDIIKEAYPNSYKVDNRHYKFERIQIKKIYNYYEKWIEKVRYHGMDYIRKNNIRPLDGTKYEWG